ncbi:oligosaccharide flippase family protein [Microbacterium trichothecenolyticum]|uniref:O-antigen/teichoic acid export membrane protein n=1 Tax=Microbacterium trichothecenolyticum TaxID=69370 RepID=A0ABU0TPN1_MICTR|nr:oligosaccharide flippase family protein [Microbacterium trichothecenolyticum]MDQ1121632.1 O-antigen/teichoic acid export membrane protein [Microbacterium trichothecenolyticum]
MKRFAGLLLAAFAAPLATFLSGPLLARALGPEGRGEIAAVASAVVVVTMLASAGSPDAASVSAARYGRPGAGYFRRHKWSLLLSVAAGSVALVVWSKTVLSGSEEAALYMQLAAVALPLLVVTEISRAAARGSKAYASIQAESWVANFGRLALLIVLLILGQLTVLSAGIATLVAAVAGGLFFWAEFTRAKTPQTIPHEMNLTRFEGSYKNKFAAITIVRVLNQRVDQVVMLPLAGSVALGYYAVAISLSQLLPLVAKALRNFTFAKVAQDSTLSATALVSRLASFFTLLAIIGLQIIAEPVIYLLFGHEFTPSVAPLRILLLAAWPLTLVSVWADGLVAISRPGIYGVAEGSALAVNLVLLFVLVPTIGAVGGALACLVAYTISASIALGALKRRSSRPLKDFLIITRDDLRRLRRM